MVQKYGDIKLETSAEYKSPIKTNISFDDTDVGSAVLRFFLTYGNQPLLLDEATTELSIFLVAHDGYFEKHDLNYDDPLNGKVSVKLTDTFLAHSGLAKGQIYIKVLGENSVITQVKFTFNIEDSLINDIPADVQMKEIRIFAELEAEINNMVNNINEKLSDGQAVVDEMNALINQAKLDLQLTVNTAKDEFEVIKTTFSNDVQTNTNNAKTEIESAKNSAVSDINALNQADTTNWQKHKLTQDNGTIKMVNLESNIDNLNNMNETGIFYTANTPNLPDGISTAGFLTVYKRTGNSPIKHIYQPYYQNKIIIRHFYNTWSNWTDVTNDNNRQWLGLLGSEESGYNSVLDLPPGYYECNIPSDAFSVDAPFDPNLGSYIAEIDVYESRNGRKQIRLRQNYSNLEYISTIHTNNKFSGWKKIVTEEYGKQQNADTGWVQWQLENGAINRNETTGEGTLYKNEYRVITTNGITRAHIRFNISNITSNAIVGRIPAKMVTKAQTGLLRSALSRNPVIYTINIDGSIKLMVHSNDIGSWDSYSYCIGEFSWIVDGEFFDNIDTGGTSGLEGESADDLVDEDIVENPDDDPDYDDPSVGDPTTDEEPSDEEIIEDGEEELPDYGDALDELDENLEVDNNG